MEDLAMRTFKSIAVLAVVLAVVLAPANASAESMLYDSRQTILTALLGAGTGAISAEASGGKAGTGALVGAGTSLIGTVLFDLLATPSGSSAPAPASYYYAQPEPQYTTATNFVPARRRSYSPPPAYTSRQVYTQPTTYVTQPAYYTYNSAPSSQGDYSRDIIKKGLMGAATGAIASEVSDGKAGTGALVGAGTQIIGSALIDVLLEAPRPQPQTVYALQPMNDPANDPAVKVSGPSKRRIVRTYDAEGNLIKEEEFLL